MNVNLPCICLCMSICMSVCVFLYVCVSVCFCLFMCVSLCVCLYLYLYVCLWMSLYVCLCVGMCVAMCVFVAVYLYVCLNIYHLRVGSKKKIDKIKTGWICLTSPSPLENQDIINVILHFGNFHLQKCVCFPTKYAYVPLISLQKTIWPNPWEKIT